MTLPEDNPYRVLVVDDSPVSLSIAKKLLTRLGFRKIEMVGDGKSALAQSAQAPFDLILLDCQMPDMDGHEVTRALRAREAGSGRRTPVVAMTGSTKAGDREKCMAAGMDDYIGKPIDAARLYEVLAKWLGMDAAPAASVPSSRQPSSLTSLGPPVDMEHLRDRIGDDEEEHRIVAGLFFNCAEESIAIMESAILQGDNRAWKKAAHKLQGSAANMGANPVWALSRRAEEMSEALGEDKGKLLQDIARACEDVRVFIAR